MLFWGLNYAIHIILKPVFHSFWELNKTVLTKRIITWNPGYCRHNLKRKGILRKLLVKLVIKQNKQTARRSSFVIGDKKNQNALMCLFRYSQIANSLRKTTARHCHIIQHIFNCKEKPIIGCYRGRNLKGANLSKEGHVARKPEVVGDSKHRRCPMALEIKEFVVPGTNETIRLKAWSNCRTKNTVYIILFPYFKMYSGKSTCAQRMKVLEHKLRLKNKKLIDWPLYGSWVLSRG